MMYLRHLILLTLIIGTHACSPVSRPPSSLASPLPTVTTPSPWPPAPELTPYESPATSSPHQVLAVVRQDSGTVNVRSGPGIDFLVVGQLTVGEAAPVIGRTNDSDWLMLDLAGTTVWVYAAFVDINGTLAGVRIAPTPPLPPL